MRPVLVFDLLGTLLDVRSLDPVLLDGLVRRMMTATILDRYRPFEELAEETFGDGIGERLRALPAYPDVLPSLERLERAGYAMHVLTNGGLADARAQLANAGIARFFRGVHSAESCERYKPDVRVYRTTLVRIDTQPHEAVMLSAHAWDLAGAQHHGMQTALVRRPGDGLADVSETLVFFPVTAGLSA